MCEIGGSVASSYGPDDEDTYCVGLVLVELVV